MIGAPDMALPRHEQLVASGCCRRPRILLIASLFAARAARAGRRLDAVPAAVASRAASAST
ncbi:MAG: hypothetical protein MZV65_20520 [Chromatiales bacterium]|nr:hypothetical protein [Chromatiales bacterium]